MPELVVKVEGKTLNGTSESIMNLGSLKGFEQGIVLARRVGHTETTLIPPVRQCTGVETFSVPHDSSDLTQLHNQVHRAARQGKRVVLKHPAPLAPSRSRNKKK